MADVVIGRPAVAENEEQISGAVEGCTADRCRQATLVTPSDSKAAMSGKPQDTSS